MNMTCNVCGSTAEPYIKDGKYICKTCGCAMGDVPAEEKKPAAAPENNGAVVNHIECPICKNKNENTVKNGKCKCALCGTEFDPQKNDNGVTPPASKTDKKPTAKSSNEQLEKEKNKNIIIGAVLLFVFWPASIYFFYKAYQISKTL